MASGVTTSAPAVPRYSRNCLAKCTDEGTPRANRAWLEEEEDDDNDDNDEGAEERCMGPRVDAVVSRGGGVQDMGT